MKTAIRKAAAVLTAMEMLGSFAVYAETGETEENIIQFSPYKIAAGTEDRVNAEFSTTFTNVDLDSGSWTNYLLRSGTTGAYNNGAYLYSQGDNTSRTITVTLRDIPRGYYDIRQFDVAAASAAINITVSCGAETVSYRTQPAQTADFEELGTDLLLDGEVTLTYKAASSAALRIDETQLIFSKDAAPESSIEPEETEAPTKIPEEPTKEPSSTPRPTFVPGEIPEEVSESKVSNVRLTGQFVEADGLEGLAVSGTCDVLYTFESENGANDNGAVICWYKSLTKDGEYTEVGDMAGSPYTFQEELGGYYVKAGVRVVTDENKITEEAYTEPLQVKYRLAFYDDFNYTATSGEDPEFTSRGWTSDKSVRVLGSPTVYCARVPENITVEDGKLKITTRKEHLNKYNDIDYDGHPHTWTTGSIWTTDAYGPYGVFDASYKLTEATGLNQSFWCMVRNAQTVENGFIEMDFNEGHYPYEMATNLHRSTGTGAVTAQNSIKHYPLGNTDGCETLADNFNRYTGMLKPNNDSYTWDSAQNSDTYQVYFNNKLLRKTRSLQYVPSPVSIFFSVAVYPGTFTGPLVDEEADGSVMEADWVAYYEFLETTKADVEAELLKAEGYIENAVIGTENGQYSQSSVDALQTVVDETKLALEEDPDTEKLTEILDSLKAAEAIFLRSVVGGYYVNVESIAFDEKDVTMLIEKTKQLNVLFTPNDANNKEVTYSSNNTAVATVDQNGVVTGKIPGTAVITATAKDGGYQAQCTVTVTDLPENQVFYEVEGGKLIFDKSSQAIIDYVGSPTEIAIPSRIEDVKVLEIAINTFKNLTTLKELRIKKGLESIGDWAFVGCTSLESVQLPESLISINSAAFQGCDKLSELTIPSSVQNIEIGAFSLCNNQKKVTFNGNAPAEVGSYAFGENTDLTIYFFTGAEGFTAPEWKGYKSEQLEGEPIPIPEPKLTEIRLTGGRDTAIRGFRLTPFKARAYDDIGDEITELEWNWSVEGSAVIENGIVTINENAKPGDVIKVRVTGKYNGDTVSAEKEIKITDSLMFDFGDEYVKTKPFLPGSMPETEIADTGITTTVTVSKSTNYSNVEIMNKDTKTQSGYYPYSNGLPGDFYYLFISGEGKNELKLPYTVRAGETIRLSFAKPYATNNGTKNRSEVNNKLDLTIGDETYSLKNNCDFDKWYTKDFVVDSDTDTITITMGAWSAIAIENIEILIDQSGGETEEPETGFISSEYNNGDIKAEFYAPDGILVLASYDENDNLAKIIVCEKSEWEKNGDTFTVSRNIGECEKVRCFLWNNISDMKPLCKSAEGV